MMDREKVINDFIESIGIISRVDEPTFWLDFVRISMENALKLLNGQEPVKPINVRTYRKMYSNIRAGYCPICNNELEEGYDNNFCCKCGRAVKWDDRN